MLDQRRIGLSLSKNLFCLSDTVNEISGCARVKVISLVASAQMTKQASILLDTAHRSLQWDELFGMHFKFSINFSMQIYTIYKDISLEDDHKFMWDQSGMCPLYIFAGSFRRFYSRDLFHINLSSRNCAWILIHLLWSKFSHSSCKK